MSRSEDASHARRTALALAAAAAALSRVPARKSPAARPSDTHPADLRGGPIQDHLVYGNVKTAQELAKEAFAAIDNTKAFAR